MRTITPFLLSIVKKFPSDLSAELVAVALGEVGCREVGDNGGASVVKYQNSTWMEPGAWPWCAAFVCWCFAAAAHTVGYLGAGPASPRATDLLVWGKSFAVLIRDFNSILPGDLIVYRFITGHHCGVAVSAVVDGRFDCVEGNTSGDGENRDGQGVFRRRRSVGLVVGVVRISS